MRDASLTAKLMGSKAAGASTGAVFAGKMKQQQSEVLMCPEIPVSRGKEGGAGGAGSREEPGRGGRRVGLGSRVPLLPGERRDPAEPSRGAQKVCAPAQAEQGPGQAEPPGQNLTRLSTGTPRPPEIPAGNGPADGSQGAQPAMMKLLFPTRTQHACGG